MDTSTSFNVGNFSKSPTGKKGPDYKKIEIIESVVFFVAMVILIIVVAVMYFTRNGLFTTYVRPPLKGQNGSAMPIGNETGTPATPLVTPGPGVVALLGSPAPMSQQEKNKINQKVNYEIPQWDAIRRAESQSTTSPQATNTGVSGFGISPELLAIFS